MRRNITNIVGALLVVGGGVVLALPSSTNATNEKVTICHKGQSISVSQRSIINVPNGHNFHDGDIIPPFDYRLNNQDHHYPGKGDYSLLPSCEPTLPPTTLPDTTLPATTLPATTLPETTLPETTLPATTLPDTTVPETTLPATTIPETTIPESTVPPSSSSSPPSPTTVPDSSSTTTSVPENTTTTPSSSSSLPSSTSTPKSGTPSNSDNPNPPTSSQSLPRTGSGIGTQVALAFGLMLTGISLMGLSRRFGRR